jgi:sirohydrochlorin cobaltochelatase
LPDRHIYGQQNLKIKPRRSNPARSSNPTAKISRPIRHPSPLFAVNHNVLSSPAANSPTAVLAVFHGSHDAQYQQAVQQFLTELQQCWRSRQSWQERQPHSLKAPAAAQLQLQGAFLDCTLEPLHEQILRFARSVMVSSPTATILIMPLFLLPGVHVMTDIPAEIALAQAQLPQLDLQTLPYLGSRPALTNALIHGFNVSDAAGRIVIAHGSRRAGGNQPVEQLAASLQAIPAFWSVAPSLTTQVTNLYDRGVRQIEVLPYFLFEGSLSAGIQTQLSAIGSEWPDLAIKLLPTLAQQPGLIELVTAALTDQQLPAAID